MKYLSLIVFLLIISSFPIALGQQFSVGEPAFQKSVEVTIGINGEVHVVHEIRKSNTITQINTIEGQISNLSVIDKNGDEVNYGISGAEQATGITIFSSNEDVIIEYDLDDALFFKDGVWYWDFFYLQSTTFIFPKEVDLGFVNETPFLLGDAKGITCHGCDAYIEYIINEPISSEQIQWEDYSFNLVIRTLANYSSFNFNQPTKSFNFDLKEKEQFVTLIIPLELLWNPYEVFLDEKKILKHEFFSNETHVWLNVKPNATGTLHVIGTTVIPEFPLIAPLFIGIAIVVALQLRSKINLH